MKKASFIIFTTLSLSIVSCNSQDYGMNSQNGFEDNQNDDSPKTAEELRLELVEEENNSPLSYLSSDNVTLQKQRVQTRKAGLFRDAEYEDDGALIEGNFSNKATLAKFKDIEVKISYYSVTKSLIDSETFVIYKFSEPNSSERFSIKIDEIPSAYDSFSFEIIGATAVRD